MRKCRLHVKHDVEAEHDRYEGWIEDRGPYPAPQAKPLGQHGKMMSRGDPHGVLMDRPPAVPRAEVLGISSSGRTCPFRAVLRGAGHAFRLVPLGAVW